MLFEVKIGNAGKVKKSALQIIFFALVDSASHIPRPEYSEHSSPPYSSGFPGYSSTTWFYLEKLQTVTFAYHNHTGQPHTCRRLELEPWRVFYLSLLGTLLHSCSHIHLSTCIQIKAADLVCNKYQMHQLSRLRFNVLKTLVLKPSVIQSTVAVCHLSTKSGEEEWNDAWETAWLPEDLSGKNRAPWETDVNFSLTETSRSGSNTTNNSEVVVPSDIDSETKAFVEDMTDNWEQRKGKPINNTMDKQGRIKKDGDGNESVSSGLHYRLEDMKRDYRLKKQRIHAGLWMKEIEKMEEAKLADSFAGGGGDDIDKLLDSCSEIFDSGNNDVNNGTNIPGMEMKNKPDGWETTAKGQDGSIWEMSQREEDILLQEFERRIAYNKFQIASFIKQHIFSRRRPIDGWKYMIEEIGPNAKKGKGSVSRLASVSDPATQPFKEEKMIPTRNNAASTTHRGR